MVTTMERAETLECLMKQVMSKEDTETLNLYKSMMEKCIERKRGHRFFKLNCAGVDQILCSVQFFPIHAIIYVIGSSSWVFTLECCLFE
ncbi:hypothetical protein ACET3Z_014198 [Daucus carota]